MPIDDSFGVSIQAEKAYQIKKKKREDESKAFIQAVKQTIKDNGLSIDFEAINDTQLKLVPQNNKPEWLKKIDVESVILWTFIVSFGLIYLLVPLLYFDVAGGKTLMTIIYPFTLTLVLIAFCIPRIEEKRETVVDKDNEWHQIKIPLNVERAVEEIIKSTPADVLTRFSIVAEKRYFCWSPFGLSVIKTGSTAYYLTIWMYGSIQGQHRVATWIE